MRLTPLPDHEWDETSRNSLASVVTPDRLNAEGAGNALATLVRNPTLAAAYLPFSAHLNATSALPVVPRELAILRLAHRTKCEYELVHHTTAARSAGISETEIEAAAEGRSDDPQTQLLFAAVDELVDDFRVSDATWAGLAEHFDEQARMDFVFTVGGYAMLAMAINSFGVQVEDEQWRAEAQASRKPAVLQG